MKRKTSLSVILLSALLMISMMSAMAYAKDKGDMPQSEKAQMRAASAEEVTMQDNDSGEVHLWVGGVSVEDGSSGIIADACESGKASVVFNDDNTQATLTLDHAVVHGKGKDPEDPGDDRYDITSRDIDLTVVLVGNNTVGSSDSGNAIRTSSLGSAYGVYGDLIIKGSGSGSKLTATGQTCGINATKRVYIENTSVEVKSNSADSILAWDEENDITISIKNSDVTAEIMDSLFSSSYYPVATINACSGGLVMDGSTVTATNRCNDRYKGYNYAISAKGDAIINDSTVTATVNNAGKYCDAIYAYDDLTISGDSTSVTAATNCTNGAIGCSGMYAHGNDGGSVKISGGQVEAAVNVEENGSFKNSGAIYAETAVSLTGATVIATVNGVGEYNDAIYAEDGNVEISGAQVEATVINGVEECCSIYADKDVVINDAAVTAATDAGRALEAANAMIDNSLVSAKGDYCAVLCSQDIDIKDSKMKDAEGQFYAERKLIIQDSKINVRAESGVLVGNEGIDIKYTESGKYSTYVEANAAKAGQSIDGFLPGLAVQAEKGSLISIDDDLAITKPEGGVVGDYKKEPYEIVTIMDGDKYADHVVIQPATYDITIDDTAGGKVKTEPDRAGEGVMVKVIATPDEGYEVDRVFIIGEDGEKTDITQKSAFTMGNSNVTVKVTFKRKAAKPVSAVRGIAKGKRTLKFTWNKVDGAASYEIWMSKCNTSEKKRAMKKVKTLSASKTTWTKKKLKKKTAYKFRVIAKDASGNVISKSLAGHAVTGNVRGGCTNAKSLKVSQSSYALTKGGTAKIKATQKKVKKGKKLLDSGHGALLRYTSNNPYVAKVDKSGRITAVGSGSCEVYVQTVNGIWKTVTVNVN